MNRDDIKEYSTDSSDMATADNSLIEDIILDNEDNSKNQNDKNRKSLFGKKNSGDNGTQKKNKEPKPVKEKKVKEPKPVKEKKVKEPKISREKKVKTPGDGKSAKVVAINILKAIGVGFKKLGGLIKKGYQAVRKFQSREESEKRKLAMQEAFKKGKTAWYRGIQMKLIVAFLVPVILFIVVGIMIYSKSSDTLTSTYESSANSSVSTLEQYLELGFDSIQLMGTRLSVNTSIENYYSGTGTDIKTESDFMEVKLAVSNEATADKYIQHIIIVSNNANTCTDEGVKDAGIYDAFIDSDAGKEVEDNSNGTPYWISKHPELDEGAAFDTNEYTLAYTCPLLNRKNKKVGYIIVDVKKSFIQDILDEAEISDGCIKGFVTKQGIEVISGSDDISFADTSFYQDAASSEEQSGFKYVSYDGKQYLFSYSVEPQTGAMICALVPKSEILSGANVILRYTLIAVFICCLIAVAIGSVLATGMSRSIKTVNKVLKKTSDGDLTGSIEMRRKDEFRILSSNILNMIKSMKELISKMTSVSGNVTESASQVDETSELLLEATKNIKEAVSFIDAGITQQSEDTDSCLGQMSELADKISNVHSNTNEINEITMTTQNAIDDGMVIISNLGERVKDTTEITKYIIQSIEELNKESKAIYSIVGTINDISEETNLLSLNASIEAARAGEAGRGFAVVSDEIRKLAEQSSQAGSQIGQIIKQIQDKMVNTMETAGKAEGIVSIQEEALDNTVDVFKMIKKHVTVLAEDIDKITESVNGIEVAKNDTMEAIESISATSNETEAASSELSRSAEKQLRAVEELSSAVKRLKDDAGDLDSSVSIFKVE